MSLRFCFLVLYASISFSTKCFGNICLPKDHVAFFIFGDSIVDVGNNNYITTYLQANFLPYGETFFKYPTGRASNGRRIPDFIAERANLPLIPPNLYPGSNRYIDGANFASIGAGVLAETRRGLEIYKKGGRKYVFLGLPPAGCAPYIKAQIPGNTGACMEELTTLVKLHNKAFSKVLPKLESQLKGFKYSLADFYSFFIERINSPSKYGFTEGKIAYCGSGPYRGIPSCGERSNEYELCEKLSDFLFFDSVHPTEKAYQQFAELIWSGTPNITGSYNLKALFEQ